MHRPGIKPSAGEHALCCLFFGLLAAAVLGHVSYHRDLYFRPTAGNREVPLPPTDSAALQSVEAIRLVLDGDRKAVRLIDAWPSAPYCMMNAALEYDIDALLLPCISRAEGPTRRMVDYRNPYGLEYRGRLIDYSGYADGWERSTRDAAKLLVKMLPAGGVDIPVLARRWCPKNESLWCANVSAIYTRALMQYKKPTTQESSDADITAD